MTDSPDDLSPAKAAIAQKRREVATRRLNQSLVLACVSLGVVAGAYNFIAGFASSGAVLTTGLVSLALAAFVVAISIATLVHARTTGPSRRPAIALAALAIVVLPIVVAIVPRDWNLANNSMRALFLAFWISVGMIFVLVIRPRIRGLRGTVAQAVVVVGIGGFALVLGQASTLLDETETVFVLNFVGDDGGLYMPRTDAMVVFNIDDREPVIMSWPDTNEFRVDRPVFVSAMRIRYVLPDQSAEPVLIEETPVDGYFALMRRISSFGYDQNGSVTRVEATFTVSE